MGNYIDKTFFEDYTQQTFDNNTTPTSTFLNQLIDDSEAEINDTTGRKWDLQTYTDEIYDSPESEVLLENTPVQTVTSVKDKDGTVLTEGYDNDYIVDGDFIVFKGKSVPERIQVTYNAGWSPVNTNVKMLATLLTIKKLKQGESYAQDNTEAITVGPISITSELSMNTVLNLDSDIDYYWKKVRRLIR